MSREDNANFGIILGWALAVVWWLFLDTVNTSDTKNESDLERL